MPRTSKRSSQPPTTKNGAPPNLNTEIIQTPTNTLKPHPRNPRRGNTTAIRNSIEQNGWYGVIVAQKTTGRVLAGNHRLQAAEQAGITTLPVAWIDVDDDTALRILLADNRTNDLAGHDDELLDEILRELQDTPLGLAGTGYEPALDIPDVEWEQPDRTVLGDRADAAFVRPVIRITDIETLEAAIIATGEINRGNAVIAICRAYLDAQR